MYKQNSGILGKRVAMKVVEMQLNQRKLVTSRSVVLCKLVWDHYH